MGNKLKLLSIFSLGGMLAGCGGGSTSGVPKPPAPGSPIIVSASATSLDAKAGGSNVTVKYTVSNNSSTPVTGFAAGILSSDSKDTSKYFHPSTGVQACGADIQPGTPCYVYYSFQAPGSATIGDYNYTVGFQYLGRQKQNPQNLTVHLTTMSGQVNVSASTKTLETTEGGAPKTATYTLNNTSSVSVHFDKVTFSQDGSSITQPNDIHISNTTSCQTIEAGKQCQISATFQPTSTANDQGSYKVNFNFLNAAMASLDLTTKITSTPPAPGVGVLTVSPAVVNGKQDPYVDSSDKLYSQPGVTSEPAIFTLHAEKGEVCVAKTGALEMTTGTTTAAPSDVTFALADVSSADLPAGDQACQLATSSTLCSSGEYAIEKDQSCDIGVTAQYKTSSTVTSDDLKAYMPQLNNALVAHLTYTNSDSSDNTVASAYGLSLSPNVLVRASLVDDNSTKAVQVNLMNPITGATIGSPVKLNISQPIDGDTCQAAFYTGNANSNVKAGSLPLFNAYFEEGGTLTLHVGCALTNSANFATLAYNVPLSKFETPPATAITPSSTMDYSSFKFTGYSAINTPQPIIGYGLFNSVSSPTKLAPNSDSAITALPSLQTYFQVGSPTTTSISADVSYPGFDSGWGTDKLANCSGGGCARFGHLFNLVGPIPSLSSYTNPIYLSTGINFASSGGFTAAYFDASPAENSTVPGTFNFFAQTPVYFTSTPKGCYIEASHDPTWPMASTFATDEDNTLKAKDYLFYASALKLNNASSSYTYGDSVTVENCLDGSETISLAGDAIYIPKISMDAFGPFGGLNTGESAYQIYKSAPYLDGSALATATGATTVRDMYLAVAPYTPHDAKLGPSDNFYYWLVMLSLDSSGKPVVNNGSAYTVYLAKRSNSDPSSLELMTTNKFSGDDTFAIVPLYLKSAP